MTFDAERPLLDAWSDKRGPEGMKQYWQEKNLHSIDGFPTGLRGGS